MTQLRDLWQAMGQPEAWVAGGWVRDRLLSRESQDLDLVVRGNLEQAAACAEGASRLLGVRAHLLGRPPRSVWRLDHHTTGVEIWALDQLSLEDDAQRRDFTCNALFWALPDGPVVDLVGGADDIESRCLRAVRRANLADDPVRLLRGCRFLAQLPSFELDPETGRWMKQLSPKLAAAPRERVGKELLTLVRSRQPQRGLEALLEHELFVHTAPATADVDLEWISRRLGLAAHLATGPSWADERTRMAALLALVLRSWGPPGGRRLHPYAWDRALLDRILVAARMLDQTRAALSSPPADRRQLLAETAEATPLLLALGEAEAASQGLDPILWRRLRRQWQRAGEDLNPPPLLSGNEVAAVTGLEPGPKLGQLLRALRLAQIRLEVRSPAGARRWLQIAHKDR